MERIKLNVTSVFGATPIGGTAPIDIVLEDAINAIQFSGKHITIKGKLFKTEDVAFAINDGQTLGVQPSTTFTFNDLIKSVKTYGLQNVTKIGNVSFPTKSIELL